MSLDRRWLLRAALAATLVIQIAIAANTWAGSARPASDFDRYYEIATGAGRPYVDYQIEHPIGTLAIFKTLALGSGGRSAFGAHIVLANLAAYLLIIGALVWGWGVAAAAMFVAIVTPILGLLLNRIDLWSTACGSVGVAAWRRDRRTVTAIAVACGAAFKLWPLLFIALIVVASPGGHEGRRRIGGTPSVTFVAVSLAIAGAWWLVAGTRGLYEVLTFRGATGWQIESTVGSVLHLAGAESLRMESGSWRIGSTSGPVGIALFAVASPLAMWSVWRGARSARVGTGWLAGVSTLLVLSPLVSAQFAVWLAPGAVIAWSEGDRRHAGIAVVGILLTAVFWAFYSAVLDSATPALLIVVARNVCLGALAVSAMATLERRQRIDDGGVRLTR